MGDTYLAIQRSVPEELYHRAPSSSIEKMAELTDQQLKRLRQLSTTESHQDHVDDISPEEESAILATMERRASQVVRRNSENWLASQNSAITQPFDMKNMKFNRRPSEKRNFSNRRASAG